MEVVTFEIAKKLKEKGFKELCLAYYTNDDILYYNYSHKAGASYTDCYLSHNLMPKDSVSGKFADAPTISQVLKWLREEKKILIAVDIIKAYPAANYIKWGYNIVLIDKYEVYHHDWNSDSFELAALAGIEYVIDNLI